MQIHDVAKSLLQDFDNRCPGASFAHLNINLNIEQAYELQFAIASMRKQRGEEIIGYKVGCTSATIQRQMGITHPVFGHVWDSETHESGCKLALSMFDNLAIEGELAVTLGEDIPSSSWLLDHPEAICDIKPVIELHNKVFYATEDKRACELIANNAIHAGIVSSSVPIRSNSDSFFMDLEVFRNGELIGATLINHFKSQMFKDLAQLVDHLVRHGESLFKNQIVLTGSTLPLWNVANQDKITVSVGSSDTVCCFVED